jgi:two-component system, OmpR family, sensor histidine kinase KdpD
MTTRKPVITLAEITTPRLDQVQQRRRRLFGLLVFVFVLVAASLVLISYFSEVVSGETVEVLNLDIVRGSLVLLALAFSLYVWEKERILTVTERALVEERVLSTALESRIRELNAILRAGRAVASTLSLEDVLELILHSAKELLNATEGSVMLLDDEKEMLHIAASIGLSDDVTRHPIPLGEGVAGWVAEFREAVILSGDIRDPRFRRFIPKDRTVRSAMSAPLYARAEAVGVLNVSVSSGRREYTEHDLRALTVFAEHAAIAIHNARLYQSEREASTKLAELDERRREFLAVVTHDLKSPLTSILGYVKLLLDADDEGSRENVQQFASIIERQGRRMLDMIEQLVVATGVNEGAPVLSREPIDLRTILDQQVDAFGAILGTRTLELDVPEEIPIVYGDPSAIEHILANLLDNAVKYSPDGTSIEVQISTDDNELLISVADRGPGIPEHVLPKVFERYRRADEHAEGGSVGLGLFIVRSLTQGHGGKVWAENREGGGARITFTLPLRRAGDRVRSTLP